MWPKCGLSAAQMWPEYEILWPVINLWTFRVARAQPGPKPQARNPARTMKKVARPSPNKILTMRRIFAKLKNVTQEEEEVFFAVKGDVMGQ